MAEGAFSRIFENFCSNNRITTVDGFKMYMATGQTNSNPVGHSSRLMKMSDFCDTRYAATGFSFAMTGASTRFTLGDIGLTGISGLAGVLKLSYFLVENFTRACKQTEIIAEKVLKVLEKSGKVLVINH